MECGGEDEEGAQPVILVARVWVEECMGDAQAIESFATHVGRKMREATKAG